MSESTGAASITLRTAVVLGVTEEACRVAADEGPAVDVPFAPPFPTPRVERVSPGHLVAVASTDHAADAVVWRWFDAVVIGEDEGGARLWEPGHGEVVAASRPAARALVPGSRAYASAGLPGADWWVAAPVPPDPAAARTDAAVELEEVRRLYDAHDLWPAVFGGTAS